MLSNTRPRLVPQDKACIDQGNIQQSLACLPVFLAGCQTLLVVAGTTYCSRLWCVMELFTFARSECLQSPAWLYLNLDGPPPRDGRIASSLTPLSFVACECAPVGGDQERVEIHLIAHPDYGETESRLLLTEQFATFNAGKAKCFLASDREHLLAVIETGFGDFDDFNRVARNLFASRVHRMSSSAALPLSWRSRSSSLRSMFAANGRGSQTSSQSQTPQVSERQ